MGILRSIVEPFVLSILEFQAQFTTCSSVGAKFVCDHDTWDAHLFANELTQKPLGGVAVASALNQSIENEALLVYGAPQPMLLAIDRDDDLVEMPLVAQARSSAADFVGEVPAEFLGPAPNRFMADDNPPCRQKVLDHSQAEGKSEMEPNGVGDDLRREAMAAIKGTLRLGHPRKIGQKPFEALT